MQLGLPLCDLNDGWSSRLQSEAIYGQQEGIAINKEVITTARREPYARRSDDEEFKPGGTMGAVFAG